MPRNATNEELSDRPCPSLENPKVHSIDVAWLGDVRPFGVQAALERPPAWHAWLQGPASTVARTIGEKRGAGGRLTRSHHVPSHLFSWRFCIGC